MAEEVIEKPFSPEGETGLKEEKIKGILSNDFGKLFNFGKKEEESDIRSKVTVVEQSDRTFADIGGNKKAKEALQELATIIKGSKVHLAVSAQVDRGYLLWGPSGNGKTELARALVGETGAIVIIVNYQDLASKWVNETPQNIKALFVLARKLSQESGRPVIIFFDEADGLFMDRDGPTSHSMHTTALSALLTEMDGAHENNEQIYVIGATNRPDGMDPAARRRFGRKIEVPNPNEEDRIEILTIHRDRIRKASEEAGYGAPIFADIPAGDLSQEEKIKHQEEYWQQVARSTEGFSGDQLARLIKRATRLAAIKLQKLLDDAKIEDLDEYLKIHPEGLSLSVVSAEEMTALADEMREEEDRSVKRGMEGSRPYSQTSSGYFGRRN